jgi:hypothetical protein
MYQTCCIATATKCPYLPMWTFHGQAYAHQTLFFQGIKKDGQFHANESCPHKHEKSIK